MKKPFSFCHLWRDTAAVLLTLFHVACVTSAVDVSGDWTVRVTNPRGTFERTFTFRQTGDKLSGQIFSPMGAREVIEEGKVEGNQIEFKVKRRQPSGDIFAVTYKGRVTGNVIEGIFAGPGGHLVHWTANRLQPRPALVGAVRGLATLALPPEKVVQCVCTDHQKRPHGH